MPFEAEQHAVPLERLCCFLGICMTGEAYPDMGADYDPETGEILE